MNDDYRSLGTIFKDLSADISTLFRSEIALLKLEISGVERLAVDLRNHDLKANVGGGRWRCLCRDDTRPSIRSNSECLCGFRY